MLTQTLRELEVDKLVKRKVYFEVLPKVEYLLTQTALQLIPFVEHLKQWGEEQLKNKNKTKTNQQRYSKLHLLICLSQIF